MSLETKSEFYIRSPNKEKISSKYIKDNVFDSFDISDLLKKDLFIPKTDISSFLYFKEIYNSNLTSTSTDISQPEKDQEEIISDINKKNHFNIEIEKLILTFKNGYEIPFINLYTPLKLIGQGHFGLVLSVVHIETNKKMAVKIIKKKKYSDEYYLLETKFLKKLNHERIIKLYDVINTKKYLYIFTELCEGGSLKDFIISRYNSNNNYFMKDSECAIIIKNIIQGVEYLANNGIIHRDLKPENIMFRKENDINSLVLGDFGLAGEIFGNSFIESKCGTLLYMAPEIIMNRKYDSLVDIWSVGIIMFILESGGRHPIYQKSMNAKDLIEFIKNKKKINFPDYFPIVARNFFLKLCKYEPFFRYNVNKVLNHPWIIRANHKIPLTVIEDIEKEYKIKNFKNMLISFIFLKQLKKIFNIHEKIKNSKKLIIKYYNINDSNNKLFTPLVKSDKYNYFFNSKEDTKIEPNLPVLNKPISRDIINKIYSSKPIKSISCFKQNIKPNNLFMIEDKKNKLKLNLRYIKNLEKNKTKKDIFIHRNVTNNIEALKENNSLIKIHPGFEHKNNFLNFDNKGKKIRLLSSNKLNGENGVLKCIGSNNYPNISRNLRRKEILLKSIIPK